MNYYLWSKPVFKFKNHQWEAVTVPEEEVQTYSIEGIKLVFDNSLLDSARVEVAHSMEKHNGLMKADQHFHMFIFINLIVQYHQIPCPHNSPNILYLFPSLSSLKPMVSHFLVNTCWTKIIYLGRLAPLQIQISRRILVISVGM